MLLRINRNAIFNDAYIPFLDEQADKQIYYGGTRSGKSVFLSDRDILDIIRYDRNFLIIRKTATSVKQSVFNEAQKSIAKFKMGKYFKINESELIITYLPARRQMFFRGIDDPEKLKSIIPINGPITDVRFEEATEISYTDYADVTVRMGGLSAVKKRVTLAFNPILRTHWIYKTFFEGRNPTINEALRLQDGKLLIHRSNYTLNKFLSEQDKQNVEDIKLRDPYRWQVYGLGEWGSLGGTIFNNWSVEDLSGVEFDTYYNGLDFGFADDPAALTRSAIRGDTLYIKSGIYQTGLTNVELARAIKPYVSDEVVFADCAEPKSIREMRTLPNGEHINVHPVAKGKDSVHHGVMWLRNFKRIVIDSKLQWLAEEFAGYCWQMNKYGDKLPMPVDKNNHGIDSLRYAHERSMRQSKPIMVMAGMLNTIDTGGFGMLESIMKSNG